MLPFKTTFEGGRRQLQELNGRLAQYLSRTQQLEEENAHLIAEINQLRHAKTTELEPRCKGEMRDLRRMVDQLSLEKSQAEMEREKLWRELQMVQSLCSEQTGVAREIGGELKGCAEELHQAHKTNDELEQRLLQLQEEIKCREDRHRREMEHLRRQVQSRVAPIVTQTYRGPPAASIEEVQEYARGMSEGWIETFEMYQRKVDEMEQSIRADQAKFSELQTEKMHYASELDKLRKEANKQGQVQSRLEEQLMHMQEQFQMDCSEYQMIIEQLEQERNMMANTIDEKVLEHQHLLRVKMDLGVEVAAYRTLLEGNRVGPQDVHSRRTQHQGERVIEIQMPSQPYTPRASSLTTRHHSDFRHTQQTSSLRRSPVPPSGSMSPSRVIPISLAGGRSRHESPASRRDMISFTKARAAASTPVTTTTTTTAKDKQRGQSGNQMSQNMQKTTAEEKIVKIQQVSQAENQVRPIKSSSTTSNTDTKSVRVVSPPMMNLSMETETESKKQVFDGRGNYRVNGAQLREKGQTELIGPSDEKLLDTLSVEEMIEKVINPAGLEDEGEAKVRYHVEKREQADGTIKTQIVLESKVEEEVDISEDAALDKLLSQGETKMSLEDIKDTATGSMIRNLLSGLQQGEVPENRSVNVEIIEEPVESQSDEEPEVGRKSRSTLQMPSSTHFQIEELENVPEYAQFKRGDTDAVKSSMTDADHYKDGSAQVQEVSRESESSSFSLDQEPHEYFVSTPDDNLSETEEGGGITSYGHFGQVDDLSDEKYYQDENPPRRKVIVEESHEYKYMPGDHSFVKEKFPECIIEEEVRVSPEVQESVLGFLRQDSLEPKDLKGALETLQGSVSGPLREELAFLTKMSSPQNVAVKKVQQSSDNGTMTIVAELNVSQSLEDSGLLDEDDLSEEQIMAALRSSNPGFEKALQGGAGGGYSFKVSTEEDITFGEEFEGFPGEGESASEITEKHFQLGPSEKSFTFQMGSHAGATNEQDLQSQEKRIATVILESPTDD